MSFGTVVVQNPKTDANGNLVVDSPASTAPGPVDVSVTFPVDTPTKASIVGKFEYVSS